MDTPAGWYPNPDNSGTLRYWDGQNWTEHAITQNLPVVYQEAPLSVSDERMWAMFSHLGSWLLGFLAPLIILLTVGNRSAFVKDQAKEALNFHITYALALIVSFLLTFVLVGFILLPIVIIGAVVYMIIASVEANKGVWYRYPINIRFIQ